jgi:signal transduction histidine kinase
MMTPSPVETGGRDEPHAVVHFGRSMIASSLLYLLAVSIPLAAMMRFGENFGVWPAAVIGITMLFLTPRALRPLMVVALATMHYVALALFLPAPLPLQLLLMVAHMVGEWGTVELTERMFRRTPDLEQPKELTRFAVVAGLITLPAAALLGGAAFAALGRGSLAREAVRWWISEVSWVLLLVPALMYLRRRQLDTTRRTARVQVLERLFFFELLIVLGIGASATTSNGSFGRVPIGIFVNPLLLWSAFRLGVGTTMWGSILVAVALVASTLSGNGIFGRLQGDTFYRLAWSQSYAFIMGLSHILLALAVRQRQAAEEDRAGILEAVRTSSARLESFFAGAPEAIAVVDADSRLVAASPAATQLLEHLRLADGSAWTRALSGDVVTQNVRLGPEQEYAVKLLPLRDVEGAIIGASASAVNLTDLRSQIAEEERSERLATVGRLAGGIAHDFNNIMMIIRGNLTLLQESIPPSDAKRGDVDEAAAAADRAVGLTRQLLAYARQQTVEPQYLDLGVHVQQMATMLERLLGADVALDVSVRCTDAAVWIDEYQLDQVIVNLSVNARDAMPEGGTLRLYVSDDVIDTARADALSMAPGRVVILVVKDEGQGIPPDALPHVFEPFFSTKQIGEGTGLGLATVDGIIRQAGGAINVVSSLQHGATFTIHLPHTPPPAAVTV